jgi:hypothetical protein
MFRRSRSPLRGTTKVIGSMVVAIVLLTMAVLMASVPAAHAEDVQRRGRRCSATFAPGVRVCAFLLVNYTLHTIRAYGEIINNSFSYEPRLNNVYLLRGGHASEPTENPGEPAAPGERQFGWSQLHFCESSPQAYMARISAFVTYLGVDYPVNWDSDLAETTCR